MKNLIDLNKLSEKLREGGGLPPRPQGKHVVKHCHWAAVHHSCAAEAFSYLDPYTKPSKIFLGAEVYYRGEKFFVITEEMIKNGGVRCTNCGLMITKEDDITPAPEIFTTKSLMRFLENTGVFLEANKFIVKSHVRVVEYLPLMGIPLDQWKEVQGSLEKQTDNLAGFAADFYNRCVAVGQCADAQSPSDILLARNLDGVGPPPGGDRQP